MKTVAAILALAGAATVAAQQIPSDLPACGRTCATNMLNQATELGCNTGDVACLCRNVNFGNGIRDCSIQFCGNVQQANQVIAWGTTLCRDANTPVTISSVSSVASPTGGAASPATSSATSTNGGAAGTTTVTGTSSSETVVTVTSTGTGLSTPVSTSTFTSVITSGTLTSTITGESTIFGVGGVAGATSLPVTTITSPILSTETEGTRTYETTVGTTTFTSSITGSALSSALSSQASAASSRTSSAQAAHMTGAPAFGVIAAAGFAAAFL